MKVVRMLDFLPAKVVVCIHALIQFYLKDSCKDGNRNKDDDEHVCGLAKYPLQLILLLYVATSGDIFKAHLKTVEFDIYTEEKITMTNPFAGLLYFLFLGRNGLLTIAMIFWIWVIYECVTKESSEGNDKVAWLLFILFVPVVGALIYYFVRRPERIKTIGQ